MAEAHQGAEHISAVLRNARKSRKFKLGTVVEATKIKEEFLEAMEAGNFDKLPAGIYQRAYLKTYAEFLGLDAAVLIKELEGVPAVEKEHEALAARMAPEPYRTSLKPSRWIVVFSIVACVAIYVLWQGDTRPKPLPTSPHERKVVEVFSNPASDITVVVSIPAQMTVLDMQGKVLEERAMQPGDTYFAPEQGQVIVRTVPENAIEVYVEGDPVASLENLEKQQGGLVLDRNKLLANTAVQ